MPLLLTKRQLVAALIQRLNFSRSLLPNSTLSSHLISSSAARLTLWAQMPKSGLDLSTHKSVEPQVIYTWLSLMSVDFISVLRISANRRTNRLGAIRVLDLTSSTDMLSLRGTTVSMILPIAELALPARHLQRLWSIKLYIYIHLICM